MLHVDHIREIEKVGRGIATGRDETVVKSWQRCLEIHHLDPSKACEAFIVPEQRLREHRQQSEDLIQIARSGLEHLFDQVAGHNYVLLLADKQGVTVEFLGDPLFDSKLRKAGLYLGAEWSEKRAGTCAVGACLATGEALTIHQTDHFDNTHTPLSCTAAPIYDTRGALSAVLDISLLSSPIIKASQNIARHLVNSTVRRIELANLMANARQEWVVRFSQSPEFLDVDPDAGISIDGGGRVMGMTHGGARILARSIGLDWRDSAAFIGQPIDRFFEIDLNELGELTHQRPTKDRLVFARDGNALFAHAIEPQQLKGRSPSRRQGLISRHETDEGTGALAGRTMKLARSALPILIQGETGTGKEHLAHAIHRASALSGKFVAINCAAIPEQLIESELFGYVAGAFTGASPKGRKGLIEEANGGTLFLDEIGDMPLSLQSRLLRVLAEGQVTPVGGVNARTVQVRILSASHRSLKSLVDQGQFREDLFYRLNAATVILPPLRERQDFDKIVADLLDRHSTGHKTLKLSSAAMSALKACPWPGNIRQLDNVIAVGAAMCEDHVIEMVDLPEEIHLAQAAQDEDHDESTLLLRRTLAASNWNVSEAARRLGRDRSTVHRQIRRLGLKQPH